MTWLELEFGNYSKRGNMNSIWIRRILKCTIFMLMFSESLCLTFSGNSSKVFVEKCKRDCSIQKDAVVCGRYRVVRWLQDVKEKEFHYGPFRIIKLPSLEGESILPRLPQVNDSRNGLVDTLRFVRDAAEDLLTKRALVYTVEYSPGARSLSSGPIVLDDDEFKKMTLSKKGYGHEESPWIHRNDVQNHLYSGYQAGYSNPYSGYYQGYRQRR